MAYLHCHNCGWSQDDFWENGGWNPVYSIKDLEPEFLGDRFREKFTTDPSFIKEHGDITCQEWLAQEFERRAKWIREMKYRTMDELKKLNPEHKCPICGKQELDID